MKRLFIFISLVAFSVSFSFGLVEAQPKPGWPKSVTIGAAPVGGVYFVWMGGFARLLNDKMGIPGSVEVTGGPVHNTQLVNAKQIDFGPATAGPIWEGWTGEGWAKGKNHQNMRVIFPMYTSYFQMYALRRTGIKSIHDLAGKRVGVGPVGGTPGIYWPRAFEILGIKPSRIVNAGSSDLNSQLKDGMLDANAQVTGTPWGLVSEVETTHEINLFGVSRADADRVVARHPYLTTAILPKDLYRSTKGVEVETISMWNFMTVHKDAPEDFVYEVVKKTFENVDILIATHASARGTRPEFIIHSPIPLHPGAIRYYRERGIKIPGRLIPK